MFGKVWMVCLNMFNSGTKIDTFFPKAHCVPVWGNITLFNSLVPSTYNILCLSYKVFDIWALRPVLWQKVHSGY